MSDLKENQENSIPEKQNGFHLLTAHIYKKDIIIKKWWEEEEFKIWLKLARGEN